MYKIIDLINKLFIYLFISLLIYFIFPPSKLYIQEYLNLDSLKM